MGNDAPPCEANFRRIFESTPGCMLAMTAEDRRIIAVTPAYAEATGAKREILLGSTFFHAFSETPSGSGFDGVENLRSSLDRVVTLRIADIMPVQLFPVRKPEGDWEERYWSVVNTPVFDDEGAVQFIIHRVEEITALLNRARDGETGDETTEVSPLISDVLLRADELGARLNGLTEKDARLRSAENLLKLGSWEYDVKSDQLLWSERALQIFGLRRGSAPNNFAEYLALVHPDDRDTLAHAHTQFVSQGLPAIVFSHRALRGDSSLCHIHGVGERHRREGREVVLGYIQDMTEHRETHAALRRSEDLLELAERKAQLGGWRVVLGSRRLEWTERTFEIHEYPPGKEPPVEQGAEFYAPEYRQRITEAFWACAREGKEYDEICELITHRGNRRWIRSMGEALRDESGRIVAVQGALQDITHLKELEFAAQEANRQRLDIIESINEAFITLDQQETITYVNRKAEDLLLQSRQELVGRNLWEAFPAAAGSSFHAAYEAVDRSGELVRFHAYYEPLSSWFEINTHKVPEGMAIYFRDITDERVNADQLRLLEHAVSRLNDIVLITEAEPMEAPDGPRIVYVNDAFERLTGFTRDEVIGQTPRILQGPKTDRQVLRELGMALQRWESVRAEIINYTKSGEEFWLEMDIVPLADANGWYTHWVAIERDITERKLAEHELRTREERFQLVTQATKDVIWDWDLGAETIWWNAAMEEIFGYPPEQLDHGSKSWADCVHAEDRAWVLESLQAALDEGATNWQAEYRFLHADGKVATVLDRGFIMRDATGTPIRMLGSISDVSEQRELEARLRESQKMEVIGQLTGGIAHDFNNLLTIIMANSELLTEQLAEQPTMQDSAQMMLHAAERGAELTNRLLAFARRQALNPKVISLNAVIKRAEGLLRRAVLATVDMRLLLQEDLAPVELDAGQFETALMNLVVNARDAMPEGGKLTIETVNGWLDTAYASQHPEVTPGAYAVVTVSDSGAGMDAITLQRAFEPFYTTKEMGKGSGLGLSMVFGFLKQSGGHIKIYSEVGEGTSVKMYFPQCQKPAPNEREAPPVEPLSGGREHILVVEDDRLVREGLAAQLRGQGYRVTTASNGAEALAVIRQDEDIALLLTDVVMPGGMNGPQLAKEAQRLRPEMRLLFTSGYTENAIVHHGRLDPGVDLLNKPYRRREMALKVRAVLDRP